jgi:thiol-disulfide isomerase/thioredoxin
MTVMAAMMLLSTTLLGQAKTYETAPEISLPGLNGQTATLSSFKGRVVLIDFWASWCGPCRHNNPRLVKFYKKYHPQGLEIISISLDQDPGEWKKAVEKDKLRWTQLNDYTDWDHSAAAAYNVNAIPSTFLIDQQGLIRLFDPSGKELENQLKLLLNTR